MNTPKGRRPAGQAHDGGAGEQAISCTPIVPRATLAAGNQAGVSDAGHLSISMTDTPKILLTITEAAQLLSLSRAHLYRLLEKGDLVSVQSGHCRHISRAALERYVAHLEGGGTR